MKIKNRYTKKRFGRSHLFYMGYDYDTLKNTDHTLAKLWAHYRKQHTIPDR